MSQSSREQQHEDAYTVTELLGWLKKQLEVIKEEYRKLGKFDKKRPLSSFLHKAKNWTGIGNIQHIHEALNTINDANTDEKTKLSNVIRMLQAIVNENVDLKKDMNKHHIRLMISMVLKELGQYKCLSTGVRKEIKTALDNKYKDIDLALTLGSRYSLLTESLKKSPKLLDIILFSAITDDKEAEKRLKEANCLAMLRSGNKEGEIVLVVRHPYYQPKQGDAIRATKDNYIDLDNKAMEKAGLKKFFVCESTTYVLAHENNACGWKKKDELSDEQNDDKQNDQSYVIKKNEELLHDDKVEIATFALLHNTPAIEVLNFLNPMFIAKNVLIPGIDAKKRFERFCEIANEQELNSSHRPY